MEDKKDTELVKSFTESNTTFDKIFASFIDSSITLSEKNEEIKKRWVAIWTLMLNHHSKLQAVIKHKEVFGVSEAVAYRDMASANRLFGDLYKSNKLATQVIHTEYAHKTYLRALQANDLQAQLKALELMHKFSGSDKEDDFMFNPEKLEVKTDKLSIPKEVANALIATLKKGVVDLNSLDFEDAEIIEDEEV